MASEEQCLPDQLNQIQLAAEPASCDQSDSLISFEECIGSSESLSDISRSVSDIQGNKLKTDETKPTLIDSFTIEEKLDENPCLLPVLEVSQVSHQCKEPKTPLTDESILGLLQGDCLDLIDENTLKLQDYDNLNLSYECGLELQQGDCLKLADERNLSLYDDSLKVTDKSIVELQENEASKLTDKSIVELWEDEAFKLTDENPLELQLDNVLKLKYGNSLELQEDNCEKQTNVYSKRQLSSKSKEGVEDVSYSQNLQACSDDFHTKNLVSNSLNFIEDEVAYLCHESVDNETKSSNLIFQTARENTDMGISFEDAICKEKQLNDFSSKEVDYNVSSNTECLNLNDPSSYDNCSSVFRDDSKKLLEHNVSLSKKGIESCQSTSQEEESKLMENVEDSVNLFKLTECDADFCSKEKRLNNAEENITKDFSNNNSTNVESSTLVNMLSEDFSLGNNEEIQNQSLLQIKTDEGIDSSMPADDSSVPANSVGIVEIDSKQSVDSESVSVLSQVEDYSKQNVDSESTIALSPADNTSQQDIDSRSVVTLCDTEYNSRRSKVSECVIALSPAEDTSQQDIDLNSAVTLCDTKCNSRQNTDSESVVTLSDAENDLKPKNIDLNNVIALSQAEVDSESVIAFSHSEDDLKQNLENTIPLSHAVVDSKLSIIKDLGFSEKNNSKNTIASDKMSDPHQFSDPVEDLSVLDNIGTLHEVLPEVDESTSVSNIVCNPQESSNNTNVGTSLHFKNSVQVPDELGNLDMDSQKNTLKVSESDSPLSVELNSPESDSPFCDEEIFNQNTEVKASNKSNNEDKSPIFSKELENEETSITNKKACNDNSNICSQATLEKCSVKGDLAHDGDDDENLSSDIIQKLVSSPVLRGPRTTVRGTRRADCRFVFNEKFSEENIQNTESEDKSYKSLRDSLDIVKHRQLICAMPIKDEDESALTSEDQDKEEESLDQEITPLEVLCVTKPLSYKKKVSVNPDGNSCNSRRVSFPEDDSRLITSYLEPVNPWYHMNNVSTDDISESYRNSCEHHDTRPLPVVLQQIAALPLGVGGRIECLSLRNQKLEAGQIECLEEIFRRVQFKTLDFESCGLDDDTAIPLFDMVEFYDSATQLNIAGNNKIGIRGWQACARILKRTPSLRILDARETSLSEQNMPILCKSLRLGTRLHTLHLENCNLTGRPLVSLAGALRLNDTISDLYLAENRLGVTDCIQLGNLVRANKTLKLLDLRNNNIQDTGCVHICKDITEQQSSQKKKMLDEGVNSSFTAGLTTLVLWNNHLTVQCIPHFASMLYVNYTLETLNLGRNNLTSEGILLLKNSLIRNRSLARLGLQATRIGNEGAVALAECIADNPVISRIDLRENSIQVAGLMALSRSLKINNTVVQLDLDPNPRAEPSPDLTTQHLAIQQEIKTLCQKNQTEVHLKKSDESKEPVESSCNEESLSPDRKISLTCGRPKSVSSFEETKTETFVSETKRYWSPAPSPCVSPCPSPSLSPSPSPMPSPLKNRFKVMKVSEEVSSTPAYIANNIFGPALDSNILSTSAPAVFTMHNSRCGSLPSLVPTTKTNRFSAGKRFTVTKVTDATVPFKSSLPANKAMSSPSLIAPIQDSTTGPTIVVSSPNKAVRGFSVDDSETNLHTKEAEYFEKGRSNSLELPLSKSGNNSPSSSDSPQNDDDVFTVDVTKEIAVISNSQTYKNTAGSSTYGRKIGFVQTHTDLFLQKAPLASVEAGSFDSDSEDSEVTTQSSDSTHSDEVRISTEQIYPKPAWELQEEGKLSKNIEINSKSLPSKNS